MNCQRCADSPVHFLVHSDVTLAGERVVSDLYVCARCAWDVDRLQLPGHEYFELTEEQKMALDSYR